MGRIPTTRGQICVELRGSFALVSPQQQTANLVFIRVGGLFLLTRLKRLAEFSRIQGMRKIICANTQTCFLPGSWNVSLPPPTIRPTNSEPEPFIKDRESAKFMSISIRTLNSHIAAGTLPSYKIGGARRFKKSELAKAMRRSGTIGEILS